MWMVVHVDLDKKMVLHVDPDNMMLQVCYEMMVQHECSDMPVVQLDCHTMVLAENHPHRIYHVQHQTGHCQMILMIH